MEQLQAGKDTCPDCLDAARDTERIITDSTPVECTDPDCGICEY